MKVFIDTNVWLAGRFGRGLCADLLDSLIMEQSELLLDERVLDEFLHIARDKFKVDDSILREAEEFFYRYATLLPAAKTPMPGIPDPDDAWILQAANNAAANWFITGDKALLELGVAEELPILDPRTAYLKLQGLAP